MTDSALTDSARPIGSTHSPTSRPTTSGSHDAPERRLLARLSDEVGPDRYARYFDRAGQVRVSEGRVDIAAQSMFEARYLERRFADSIRRAANQEFSVEDPGSIELNFTVEEANTPDRESKPSDTRGPKPSGPGRPAAQSLASGRRLEEFIVGDANRLAYSAAVRVADDQSGADLSPLFIHGVCGVGKTHLLQGIAARYRERHPGASVRYTTAEAFTNAYVQSIRTNNLNTFRRRFRSVDLLCIDDVHFFARKKSTQSELLHTFDAIGLDGSRVVLASDGHPAQIEQMNESLRSRFLAGMVVRLDPPEQELRVKLVRTLARRRHLMLQEASVAAIARQCNPSGQGASVRELEGMLTRVDACHKMLAGGTGAVDASAVCLALGANAPTTIARPLKPVRVADIIAEVCRTLSVERDDVFGRGRHRRVVLARALCAHITRQLTTLSYPEIARAIGRPNHSSVITACNRLGRQMASHERVLVGHEEVDLSVLENRIAGRVSEAAARQS